MEVRSHTKCILCNSDQLKELPRYKEHHLVACQNCHFIFSQQIPQREELKTYYEKNYDRTSYFSPITAKRYEELLDSWEPFRKTNRILDVGCGNGFFLQIAQAKGWEVYGIEIAEDACKICKAKGIPVFQGTVEEFASSHDFDIIVSIEVIEHLSFPNTFSEKIYALLRPGGLFYLTTPNFNAALRYRLKENYDIIDFPNHLSYFTAHTLEQLLHKTGFQTLHIQTTGISLTRFKTSRGKSNQEYVSETSDDEMLRFKIEHNGFLRVGKKMINGALNLLRVGDSIKASFIKPEKP